MNQKIFRNEEKKIYIVLEIKKSGHKSATMAIINHERCSSVWWSVSTCEVSSDFFLSNFKDMSNFNTRRNAVGLRGRHHYLFA